MEYPPPPTAASWPAHSPSLDKSSQLLIREYPHRAIAIASPSHALIFRHSSTTSEAIANGSLASVASARPRIGGADGIASKCMVEFTSTSGQTLNDYRPLTPRPIYGTLGLISVTGDVFLAVVTQATRAATVRPGETVEKISDVAFFCVNSSQYDNVVSVDAFDSEMSDNQSVYGQNLSRRELTEEHPCHELQKLLSNGTFYYSTDFDVTNRLQDRYFCLTYQILCCSLTKKGP
jgi:synaptojanin